jgi:AraC-like DNA-binding protein
MAFKTAGPPMCRTGPTSHMGKDLLPAHRSDTVIWRDESLAGAEWLRGTYSDFAYAPHAHDADCLAVITRGALRIRAAGCEVIARRGDMFLANADVLHAGWPIDDAGWSLRTMYVSLDRLRAVLTGEPVTSTGTLCGPFVQDPDLCARLIAAHECSEGVGSGLRRDEALVAFTDRLFARYVRPARLDDAIDSAPRAVRRAREFLDAHIDTRISLPDLAGITGLPPSRLLRAFARAVGMSPHAYQRQVRLRHATTLIRAGTSISDAALAAGFADQAHFTRLFRATMGITPGAYQRAYRRGGATSPALTALR